MDPVLGLAGYYRRFIDELSKIATTLKQLLKKNIKFNWSEKQLEAFELLKEKSCREPLLQKQDFSQSFVLATDASGFTIEGILSQDKIGKDKRIVYTSRPLNDYETKYDTYEKEASAIIYCVTYFCSYLYGRKFTLATDNKQLVPIISKLTSN